jgi:hypothetical protein
MWTGFNCSTELGNELSGSIKGSEFLEQVSSHQLLKKYHAPYFWLIIDYELYQHGNCSNSEFGAILQ